MQEQAAEGRVISAKLSNGDKFVIFKRMELASFLSMIEFHFPELKCNSSLLTLDEDEGRHGVSSDIIEPVGIITSVKDAPDVMRLVDSLKATCSTLKIVAECFNAFGNRYSNMRFSNWTNIVSRYLENYG